MTDTATDGAWTGETPLPPVRLDETQVAVHDRQLRVAPLWDLAMESVTSNPGNAIALTTRSDGSFDGSVKPVYEAGVLIGALVMFRGSEGGMVRAKRARFGWESLTESERTLARLVADGLTNRQAAARLCVSRHTVDSHLRHIFRKLGINSRVQLATTATAMLDELNKRPPRAATPPTLPPQSRLTTVPSILPSSGSWPNAPGRPRSSSPPRATWAASPTTRHAS
jgi:DNA-binding CsgD family transcriptional regulator